MELLTQPWPWYIAGPAISFVLFLLFYFGKSFGVSTNLETFCTLVGAGKVVDYFKTDWKDKTWSLIFVVGIVIGGFLSSKYLMTSYQIDLNPKTVHELEGFGFANPGANFLPAEIFSTENLFSLKGIILLIIAGLFIGFGTRYASGCTSGHAITGLSSLQLPSLIAVIGFFAGGLLMTWILFPLIF